MKISEYHTVLNTNKQHIDNLYVFLLPLQFQTSPSPKKNQRHWTVGRITWVVQKSQRAQIPFAERTHLGRFCVKKLPQYSDVTMYIFYLVNMVR